MTFKFVIFFATIIMVASSLEPCKKDGDCGYQKYCYITKFCTDCEKCERYNRRDGPICARTPQDCGDCLEGYFENLESERFDGKRHKCCLKPAVEQAAVEQEAEDLNFNWKSALIFGTFGIAAISIFMFAALKYRRSAIKNTDNDVEACQPFNPSAPLEIFTPAARSLPDLPPSYDASFTRARHVESVPFVAPRYISPPDPLIHDAAEPEQLPVDNNGRQVNETAPNQPAIPSCLNSDASNCDADSGGSGNQDNGQSGQQTPGNNVNIQDNMSTFIVNQHFQINVVQPRGPHEDGVAAGSYEHSDFKITADLSNTNFMPYVASTTAGEASVNEASNALAAVIEDVDTDPEDDLPGQQLVSYNYFDQ